MSGPFGSTPHNLFNTTATGFYNNVINQSLRFNDNDNANLTYTPSSSGNRKTWTLSLWVKRSNIPGANKPFFSAGTSGTSWAIFFSSDEQLFIQSRSSSSNQFVHKTAEVFRDAAQWLHVLYAFDTTQTNQEDRAKLYVNGKQIDLVQHTSNTIYPSQNTDYHVNNSSLTHYIGYGATHSGYHDGYIAELHFVDGTAYDPTNFGETKDGVWIAKAYEGGHGTYGYYLPFDDSSAIGDDKSANTNDWTPNNLAATDVVPDSPENNYCTFNSNDLYSYTLSEGNLKAVNTTNNRTVKGTFLMESGKWYWEVRRHNTSSDGGSILVLVGVSINGTNTQDNPYNSTGNYTYSSHSGVKYTAGSSASYGDNWRAAGDIIGVAFDADAGACWFSKNGTWQNSATTSEIAAGTTTNAAFTGLTNTDGYVPVFGRSGGTSSNELDVNFGQNPSFNAELTGGDVGTEAGDGNALFKYPPPAGFKALCTENFEDATIGPNKDEQANDNFDVIIYEGNGQELAVGTGGLRRPLDTMSIAQSLRFDDSSLHYDITSSGNTRTFTFSAWVKRSSLGGSSGQYIYADGKSSSTSSLNFDANDKIYAQLRDTTGGTSKYKLTTREFKSLKTWYHIVWRVDTTQAAQADRSRIYINGKQLTAFDTEQHVDQNDETTINASGNDHLIGAYNTGSTSRHLDGYMAEVNFADGQSYGPENFGQTGSNGDWIPKTLGTISYGTNGFRLDFADSSDLGNNANSTDGTNDFDVTDNVSSHDQVVDSPTQNFATLDALRPSGTTLDLTEGALKGNRSSSSFAQAYSNVVITEGKFYAEFYIDTGNADPGVIVGTTIPGSNRYLGQDTYTYGYYRDGRKINSGSYTSYGGTYTAAADGSGDIVGVLINADDGEISFAVNGTVQNSGVPAFSGLTGPYRFALDSESNGFVVVNFGQDDTFAGLKTSGSAAASDENGKGKFFATPPSGFLALMDDNLPRQSDVKGPDWVWIKNRDDNSTEHSLHDVLRGTQQLESSASDGQDDESNYLLSFDSQGFTVGDDGDVNTNLKNYVGWVWKAGGTPTVDNSAANDAQPTAGSAKIDGSNKVGAFSGSPSIAIKRLSANTTAGFSMVTWTGTGAAGTIPHGLGKTPQAYIVKCISNDSTNWRVYHSGIASDAETDYISLDLTNGAADLNFWNDTAPDNNVFSVANYDDTNTSSRTYIAYVFANIEGYSKFGTYEGNNSSLNHVYTGFRPAWLLIKNADASYNWMLVDTTREPFNDGLVNNFLRPNLTDKESTAGELDLVSNGFILRDNSSDTNASASFIYFSFAEAPFKYANAR